MKLDDEQSKFCPTKSHFPNRFVKIAMGLCDSKIILDSKVYNSFEKINKFIIDYINFFLIPKVKKKDNVYKPNKVYLRLEENEINEECIRLFANDLKKYVLKRVAIF